MRILRNYILKECFLPFFIALVVLTSVFLLGNLITLANLVINKGVPISIVGQAFLLSIPLLLGYTLPIASLFAIIVAFSRMSSDNEILALRASGFQILRLLLPLITLGIIISLVALILNDKLIPYAHHTRHKLLKNIGIQNPTAMLEPGVFIHAFQGQIIFIHKIDGSRMENITIYQPQENRPTRTIIAKKGEFTNVPGTDQVKLKLIDGTSDEPNLEDGNSFYKLNFKNYFMTLDLAKDTKKLQKKPKSMTIKELRNEIDRLHVLLVDTERYETELMRKVTISLSPIVFVLLGFPIAVITNKREKSANVVLAFACASIYYLLSLGAEALAREGIIDPYIIMWAPNIIGLCVAVYLNVKCAS